MLRNGKRAVWGFVCFGMLVGLAAPVGNAGPCDTLTDITDLPFPQPEDDLHGVLGIASWYSEHDPGVRRYTASGKRFDSSRLWAASWVYPFGTRLKVTSLKTARSVEVVVEDRGPAKRLNRALDLTRTAFSHIAHPGEGLIEVEITPIPD